MKPNKLVALVTLLFAPALCFASGNPMYNAIINVTVIAALLTVVFVIASLGMHIGTIAKVLVKKSQEPKSWIIALVTLGLCSAVPSHAEATNPLVDAPVSGLMPTTILVIVFALMLLLVVFLSRTMFSMLGMLLGIEVVKKEEVANVAKESFWKRFVDKWNSAVPVEREADVMLDHDYDGIRELDNSLPPWWKYGFYLTIVFACVYFFHYTAGGSGLSQREEYQAEMDAAQKQKELLAVSAPSAVDENTVTALTDDASLANGRKIFVQNCVTCHGANAEGLAGPNLTDKYWLHGGGIKNIFSTVKNGVISKGMVKWDGILKPQEIHEVASYVLSLQQHPVAGKEPQGDMYNPDVTAVVDTTKK